ncbi:30S ribosomal protein S2 [Candidatus Kaiserbacteria bacterium]|nr:30S ribosomal protein S2 [Candidatus Kaiserbacteria bacterium]
MSENTKQNLIERLFKAGAHFGFTKSRRHPTVVPYLYGNKQGTDIFDLEKTTELLEAAKEAVKEMGAKGKTVLFVGTKDEASKLVKAASEKAESPFVVNRWIGGMITNFAEIKKRIKRLLDLTEQGESGELERKYTKKERVLIGRELEKLTFNFGGIKTLERTPDMLVVVDPRHDAIAVAEAKERNIPVVGISSSDGDLSLVTYPVVCNDALTESVSLVLTEIVDAYLEGKKATATA